MTVAELIEALEGFDPTNLVVVDTIGERPRTISLVDESYDCVTLEVSEWPSEELPAPIEPEMRVVSTTKPRHVGKIW